MKFRSALVAIVIAAATLVISQSAAASTASTGPSVGTYGPQLARGANSALGALAQAAPKQMFAARPGAAPTSVRSSGVVPSEDGGSQKSSACESKSLAAQTIRKCTLFGQDFQFDPTWGPSEMVHVTHLDSGLLVMTGIASGAIEIEINEGDAPTRDVEQWPDLAIASMSISEPLYGSSPTVSDIGVRGPLFTAATQGPGHEVRGHPTGRY